MTRSLLWPCPAALRDDLTAHQRDRLAEIFAGPLAGPVALLTGTPGTGKTYCVGAVVDALVRELGEAAVCVCAPTGKAAVRCTAAIRRVSRARIAATTIHQKLEIGANGHADGDWGFKRNRDNPLDEKVVILDECFPGTTKIQTPRGGKYIRDILPGDAILNAIGEDRVVAVKKTEVNRVCKISCGAKTVWCSESHPFFTDRGIIFAGSIRPGLSLIQTGPAVRLLRQTNPAARAERGFQALLQSVLFGELVESVPGTHRQMPHARGEAQEGGLAEPVAKIRASQRVGGNRPHHRPESYGPPRRSGQGVRHAESDGTPSNGQRWQREGSDQNSGAALEAARVRQLADGVCRSTREKSKVPDPLQTGPGGTGAADSDRTGRPVASLPLAPGRRQAEDDEAVFARVDGIAILEPGDGELDQFRDADGKLYFYDLQAARHPSFSAEGFLVHNCSMLDTDLAAALLSACAAGTHLLFVGDPDQLPPVGHGAPLRDMIAAGLPCAELTEIRRNAGLIVHACRAIRDGRDWDIADKYDAANGLNLRHMEAGDGAAVARVLESVLTRFRESGTFDPAWGVQIICGTNRTRKILNRQLQTLLNPAGDGDGTRWKHPFRKDDKIICLRNHLCEGATADGRASGSTYYVANGEIGRVLASEESRMIVDMAGGRPALRVPIGKVRARDEDGEGGEGEGGGGEDSRSGASGAGCHFDLAYCVTGHKMQGSEAPCVIVVIEEGAGVGRVCSKEWLYTALSRASQLCITVGREGVMRQMARRESLTKRKTFLKELLTNG